MKKPKTPKWTCILMTRDGFCKAHFQDELTSAIEVNWWMPGLIVLHFECVYVDKESHTAHYLIGK